MPLGEEVAKQRSCLQRACNNLDKARQLYTNALESAIHEHAEKHALARITTGLAVIYDLMREDHGSSATYNEIAAHRELLKSAASANRLIQR